MKQPKRVFTIEFKQECVNLVFNQSYSVMQAAGATLMQKLKVSREVVNLCQNHVIGSKVDRVYLLDDYADEKHEAWDKLGDRLEAILSTSNVVSLKSA